MDSGVLVKSSIRPKTLNKRSHTGETALHLACKKQDLSLVKALIKAGIHVNCPDYAGWTALHEAAVKGDTAVVEVLLEAEAQVNARSLDGHTPLHDAVRSGNYQVVKLLLERGSNPQDKNMVGLCAVDMAEGRDMRELLRKYQLYTAPSVSCLESTVCMNARAPHSSTLRQSAPKGTLILSEVQAKLTEVEGLSLAGHCQTERQLTALWDIYYALTQVLAEQHMAKDSLAHKYWSVPDCLRKRVLKSQLISLVSAQRKLVDTIQKQMQVVEEFVTLCNSEQRYTSHSPAPTTTHHQQSVSHPLLPTGSQSSIMVPVLVSTQDKKGPRSPLVSSLSSGAGVVQKKAEDKLLTSPLDSEFISTGATLLFSSKIPLGARPGSDHRLSVEQSKSCAMEKGQCSPSILDCTSTGTYWCFTDVDGLALVMKVRVVHVVGDDELVPNALMDQYWEKMLKEDSLTF